jgi:hypothetical protein
MTITSTSPINTPNNTTTTTPKQLTYNGILPLFLMMNNTNLTKKQMSWYHIEEKKIEHTITTTNDQKKNQHSFLNSHNNIPLLFQPVKTIFQPQQRQQHQPKLPKPIIIIATSSATTTTTTTTTTSSSSPSLHFLDINKLTTLNDFRQFWLFRLLFPNPTLGMIKEQEPLLGHLKPASIMQLLAKSSILTFAQRTSAIQHRVDELDAKDELPENLELQDIFSPTQTYKNEFNIWNGFIPGVKKLFTRDFSVISILRLYEHILVFFAPYKVARSMTKSVTNSAMRKMNRGMTNVVAAQKMLSSAFSAQILYWSALFTYGVITEGMFYPGIWPPKPLPPRIAMKQIYKLLVRCVSGCFCASFGASIGTLLFPGPGTLVGSVLFPSIAMVFLP